MLPLNLVLELGEVFLSLLPRQQEALNGNE
jgi:hypothetical protein